MKDKDLSDFSEVQIKLALQSVSESKTFEDVHRLRAFLEYAVTSALSTGGKRLPAKLIAADVYERQTEEGVDAEAIVRVDAGRLRRRLEVYYATEGLADPVLISIPKGGYSPAFSLNPHSTTQTNEEAQQVAKSQHLSLPVFAALAIILCVGFLGGWMAKPVSDVEADLAAAPPEIPGFDTDAEIRLSISQVSSASLLARTFVEEARHLTFPSIDPARPMAAEILCKRAIQMAPELATGHSCDAFVQAFFAFLSPPGIERDTRLRNALSEVDAALRIDPADSFSLMAAAWTEFAGGQRSAAVEKAKSAVSIDPTEPFLRNFYGMMMTFEGRGAELLSQGLASTTNAKPADLYHPFILAGAKLQEKDYDGVIKAVERAVALEGRTSQLITTIQISALENSGDSSAAEALAQNMYDTWKVEDIRNPLQRLFSKSSDVEAIAGPVEAVFARAGLQIAPNN